MHPHLKTNEELLSYWYGDFHDKEQVQALKELAKRKVDDFGEQLKSALAKGEFDSDEIQWTFFEYIYDNDFVVDYVNNPKLYYNVEKALFYIKWAIPNDFSLPEYLKLNDKAKDGLLRYQIKELKDKNRKMCDFESLVCHVCKGKEDFCFQGCIEPFDEIIRKNSIIQQGYIDYLNKTDDLPRLMALEAQIAKMKNELHQSFVKWLYEELPLSSTSSCVKAEPLKRYYSFEESVLLKKLQVILHAEGLSLNTIPKVYISYEVPMSLRLVENRDDNGNLFDTENLLGYYIPSSQEIVLLEQGIRWFAARFSVNADLLREIVFIHEMGHYMQHKMPCYQTQEWDDVLYNDSYSPIDLQEGWAQLMDAWAVKNEKHYSDVFNKLVSKQRAPYLVFQNYEQYKYHSILQSLDGLRQLNRPAAIEDWDRLLA